MEPIENECIEKLKKAGIDDMGVIDNRSIRIVNKVFRDRDESNLYPINGRFNATERAIRKYRNVYFASNGPCSVYEYILGLDHLIGEIVNSI